MLYERGQMYVQQYPGKLRNTCIVHTRRPLQHAVNMRAPNYFVCCVGPGVAFSLARLMSISCFRHGSTSSTTSSYV